MLVPHRIEDSDQPSTSHCFECENFLMDVYHQVPDVSRSCTHGERCWFEYLAWCTSLRLIVALALLYPYGPDKTWVD